VNIDIGAKRPIDGNKIFLVGRLLVSSEPSYVLLYDEHTGRESKRNLLKVDPEKLVAQLGGAESFVSIDIPGWGTAWFRSSKIRRIIEMPESYLKLSSAGFGARVLFDHDSDPPDDSFVPNIGFSLYGITVEQASKLLRQRA